MAAGAKRKRRGCITADATPPPREAFGAGAVPKEEASLAPQSRLVGQVLPGTVRASATYSRNTLLRKRTGPTAPDAWSGIEELLIHAAELAAA